MTINPELKAKIDALPYEALKADILEMLDSPGDRSATDEEIVDLMTESYMEVMAQRALREARMYRWRDDEVIAFIEHFKKEMPQMYAGYLGQERNGRQIDFDLASDMERLAEQWHPGLDDADYGDLFGMVRDYAQAHLI